MKNFIDDVSANNCFVFGSSLTNNYTSINSEQSSRIFLEKTIFGKKIMPEDIKFMIKNNVWATGKIYDQYDDSVDLNKLDYYVVSSPSSPSGDYYVFKCLDNNYGSISSDKPTYNGSLPAKNYILLTSDGYKWKFMYRVTSADVETYSSETLFPIMPSNTVSADAKNGIDNIIVNNPLVNFGYEQKTGTVLSVNAMNVGGGRILHLVSPGFRQLAGYYTNFCFYVTSSDGITTRKYIIQDSGIGADANPFVKVANYVFGDINNLSSTTWTFSILPQVQITGDGTGVSAISVLTGSRISGIKILDSGVDYTRAIARIVSPLFGFNAASIVSSDVTCLLDVILPPTGNFRPYGGHGKTPQIELNSSNLLISSFFSGANSEIIPATNTYSKVGIVKTPAFTTTGVNIFDNRVKVTLSSAAQLNVGDPVTQTNFNAVIHAIDIINNIIYLTEYFGPYTDQSESDIFFLSDISALDPGTPITTPIGRIDILAVVLPYYSQGTGEVLYVTDFDPITRSTNLAEQFKFIIDF